ncbi:hypothetical protein BC332_34764 [Capsicum chinense]|nr:hypothetical protein BC332_34764 [Capsicum chinense]
MFLSAYQIRLAHHTINELNESYAAHLPDSVETIHRADIRLSDISNLLGEDWVLLAQELGVTDIDVQLIESEYPSSVQQQAIVMLKLWIKIAGNRATVQGLVAVTWPQMSSPDTGSPLLGYARGCWISGHAL